MVRSGRVLPLVMVFALLSACASYSDYYNYENTMDANDNAAIAFTRANLGVQRVVAALPRDGNEGDREWSAEPDLPTRSAPWFCPDEYDVSYGYGPDDAAALTYWVSLHLREVVRYGSATYNENADITNKLPRIRTCLDGTTPEAAENDDIPPDD